MSNLVAIIIIGIYTIIYAIIFFVQKTQIDKVNKINEAMERFNNIMDIGRVEDYVKLNDKLAQGKAQMYVNESIANLKDDIYKYMEDFYNNHPLMQESFNNLFDRKEIEEVVKENINILSHSIRKEYEKQINELMAFTIQVISETPKEKIDDVLNSFINTKHILKPLIEEFKAKKSKTNA